MKLHEILNVVDDDALIDVEVVFYNNDWVDSYRGTKIEIIERFEKYFRSCLVSTVKRVAAGAELGYELLYIEVML